MPLEFVCFLFNYRLFYRYFVSSWRAFSALFGLVSMALLTPEPRVPKERISSDLKMVHLWDVAKNAQAE